MFFLESIEHQLDTHQPEEQHGFRRGKRIEEHLLTANAFLNKSSAVGIPVVVVSLDLSKAFDSVHWPAFWKSLLEQVEIEGRWSNETSSFIRMLAQAIARSSPPSVGAATASALVSRWSALLTAAASSFAASLLFEDLSTGRRSPTPRPTPLRHQLGCTDQSPPSPVKEGLGLHLPYQKHIWRLASKNSLCLEAAQ